jgi:hypothetical protein
VDSITDGELPKRHSVFGRFHTCSLENNKPLSGLDSHNQRVFGQEHLFKMVR